MRTYPQSHYPNPWRKRINPVGLLYKVVAVTGGSLALYTTGASSRILGNDVCQSYYKVKYMSLVIFGAPVEESSSLFASSAVSHSNGLLVDQVLTAQTVSQYW